MRLFHPENSIAVEPAPHSASVTQIETLGRGVYAVLVGGVIMAAILSGMALMRAEALNNQLAAERTRHESVEATLRAQFASTETEARMSEYYILELDGKLMASGFIPPSRGYGQWKQERKR
jgi:hypothetical protein